MVNLRSVYIAVLFVLLYAIVNGQTIVIERLKTNIQKAKTANEKLQSILSLCDQGYSLHPDTLMAYAEKARIIAHQNHNLHDETEALYYQSYALTNKGLIDSSLNLANECLATLEGQVKDLVLLANVLNQKGRCYMRKNQYKEAIDMGYKVIDASEKGRDTILQMKGKTLIAWAYLEIGQTKEALNWHLKALRTTNNTRLLESYSILFANLALNYNGLGKTDSAFYFITKAVNYSRKYQNLFALSNSLAIQAQLYVRSGKANLAEQPLKEVVTIRKLIGDPFYIVSDMAQLGLYYANNGQPEKGIAICNEGIIIANEYKIGTKLFFLYSTLGENYKAAGDNAKYAAVLEKIISLKDSVYQQNSATALAEMQTKYDLQKKENTIIQQKLDITKKNYLLYGAVFLSALVFLSGYLLFKNYRKRQLMKLQLALEREKRQTEKAVTGAEEKERKRIAADLHDNLGAYANAVLHGTELLQQENTNGHNKELVKDLNNASKEVITSLRETIWALKKENYTAEECLLRIRNFIQTLNRYYEHISFEVKGNAPDNFNVHYSKALNLVRMLQEAITNAIKHSGARNINVISETESNDPIAIGWKIKVVDDGKGFSVENLRDNDESNGLINLQQRAKTSGIGLFINAEDGKGTTIEIRINQDKTIIQT